MTGEVGFLYRLHYLVAIGTTGRNSAQHYSGFSPDNHLETRIASHANGMSGAKLPRAFYERGIPFMVADIWRGTRDDERRVKSNGHASDHCSVCAILRAQKSVRSEGRNNVTDVRIVRIIAEELARLDRWAREGNMALTA